MALVGAGVHLNSRRMPPAKAELRFPSLKNLRCGVGYTGKAKQVAHSISTMIGNIIGHLLPVLKTRMYCLSTILLLLFLNMLCQSTR